MAIVGTILMWLLVGLSGLLLFLLCMPIQVAAYGEVDRWSADGRAVASWAFGLIGVRANREKGAQFCLFGLPVARLSGGGTDGRDKKRKKKKRQKRGKRGLRWGWGNRALFVRLVRTLHIRGELSGVLGTGDPADTAQVASLLEPIVEGMPWFDADVQWDYLDEAFVLEGTVWARLWPIEPLLVLLGAMIRRKSRRALMSTT